MEDLDGGVVDGCTNAFVCEHGGGAGVCDP